MPTSKGQIRQTLHWGSLSVPAKAHKEHILGCRVGNSYSRDLGKPVREDLAAQPEWEGVGSDSS